jgi:FkbM family methyltransferase
MQTIATKRQYPKILHNIMHNIYPLSLRERLAFRIHNKFVLPHKNIELLFNTALKMDLSADDVGHQCIILSGFYELGLSRLILQQAKKGGILMDVGANYGYYSLLWAGQNPQNQVIAFEASPKNIKPLTHNINKNRLPQSIRIEPIAVSDYTGSISFSMMDEEGQTGWGGISAKPKEQDIVVPCITLDDYCKTNTITQIDFLKIDVEGADTMVLRGAKNLLKNHQIKMIAFEENIERMALLKIKKNEALDLLQQYGYTLKSMGIGEYLAFLQ